MFRNMKIHSPSSFNNFQIESLRVAVTLILPVAVLLPLPQNCSNVRSVFKEFKVIKIALLKWSSITRNIFTPFADLTRPVSFPTLTSHCLHIKSILSPLLQLWLAKILAAFPYVINSLPPPNHFNTHLNQIPSSQRMRWHITPTNWKDNRQTSKYLLPKTIYFYENGNTVY